MKDTTVTQRKKWSVHVCVCDVGMEIFQERERGMVKAKDKEEGETIA